MVSGPQVSTRTHNFIDSFDAENNHEQSDLYRCKFNVNYCINMYYVGFMSLLNAGTSWDLLEPPTYHSLKRHKIEAYWLVTFEVLLHKHL
jgi:hypothetical protein